jgi:hypothetical protein
MRNLLVVFSCENCYAYQVSLFGNEVGPVNESTASAGCSYASPFSRARLSFVNQPLSLCHTGVTASRYPGFMLTFSSGMGTDDQSPYGHASSKHSVHRSVCRDLRHTPSGRVRCFARNHANGPRRRDHLSSRTSRTLSRLLSGSPSAPRSIAGRLRTTRDTLMRTCMRGRCNCGRRFCATNSPRRERIVGTSNTPNPSGFIFRLQRRSTTLAHFRAITLEDRSYA